MMAVPQSSQMQLIFAFDGHPLKKCSCEFPINGMAKINFAVSECNFSADENLQKAAPFPFLELHIGDRVHVLAEEEGWGYGYKDGSPAIRGLFPLDIISYAESSTLVVKKKGAVDAVILDEIQSTLTLWWPKIQEMLRSQSEIHFLVDLLQIMESLFRVKRRVEADNLPVGELSALRKEVCRKIDRGSKFLKLPMQIRDSSGRPFLPGELSIVEAFSLYVKKHDMLSDDSKKTNSTHTTAEFRSLLLEVKSVHLKFCFNVEIWMALFDDQGNYITEPFSFIWQALQQKFDREHIKCLFKGIPPDVDLAKVVLATRVSRIAPIEHSGTLRKPSAAVFDRNPAHYCRQPFAFDIRDIKGLLNLSNEQELNHHVIILNREDSFDETLYKFGAMKKVDHPTSKGSGDEARMIISTALLHGSSSQMIRRHPHFFIDRPPIQLKTQLLSDSRNDSKRNELYVTLLYGDFPTKAVDKKNVEVRLALVDSKDRVIDGCFSYPGSSKEFADHHCSFVHINEEKPKWMECIKILLPDRISNAVVYLRMTCYVKRPTDRNKQEKGPFALSYLKILENGAPLENGKQDPLVYKIDSAKYEAPNADFLQLPSTRKKLRELGPSAKHSAAGPFTLSEKCSLIISTNIVSGIVPQCHRIRTILDHKVYASEIQKALIWLSKDREFGSYDEEQEKKRSEIEMVHFSEAIVNALFDIWDERENLELQVFNVLVTLLFIHSESRFARYKWRMYAIAERITHTTAAFRILRCLSHAVSTRNPSELPTSKIALKSMGWLAAAVAQSHRAGMLVGIDTDKSCDRALETLLCSIEDLVQEEDSPLVIPLQNLAVNHLPDLITPLLMNPKEMKRFSTLSTQSSESKDSSQTGHLVAQQNDILRECKGLLDPSRLTGHLDFILDHCCSSVMDTQKIKFINQIIHSPLFMIEQSRERLLESFLRLLLRLLELDEESANDQEKSAKATSCTKTVLTLIEKLFPTKERGGTNIGTGAELELIITLSLRTVVRTAVFVGRSNLPMKVGDARSYIYTLVITLLHHTSASIFKTYISNHEENKIDVIVEMLVMVRDILCNGPFDSTWTIMIRETNRIVYQVLLFVLAIQKNLEHGQPFSELWKEYMLSLIAFIIHASQRDYKASESEELVRNAIIELRSTWFMLSPAQKMGHIPKMVQDFLKVALIAHNEQGEIIKVICDMMQTEFSVSDSQRRSFDETAREIYIQLDELLANHNMGSRSFREMFIHFMEQNLSQDAEMWSSVGESFVVEINKILILLFDYRSAKEKNASVETRMKTIVNLLKIYQQNEQQQLAIRYVYMLYQLHLECGHYIEAANTLKIHAAMTSWENREVPDYAIANNQHRNCATESALKAALLSEVADLYAKGTLYEEAIHTYRQVIDHYEKTLVNYQLTSANLIEQGNLFKRIHQGDRAHPFYYFVAFYGQGFPSSLVGKQFVYHSTAEYRLNEFCERIVKMYQGANIIKDSNEHSDMKYTSGKYIQIFSLTPVSNALPFEDGDASEAIKMYYKYYHVQKFAFTRSFKNPNSKWAPYATNDQSKEIVTMYIQRYYVVPADELPGILTFSQIVSISEPHVETPIMQALTSMKDKNDSITSSARKLLNSPEQAVAHNIEMSVQGICSARVMGGVANYEPLFAPQLQQSYSEEEMAQVERLRHLIIHQVVLIEYALYAHKAAGIQNMHDTLVACYKEYKKYIEDKFGPVEESLLRSGETIETEKRISASNASLAPVVTYGPSNTMTRRMKNKIIRNSNIFGVMISPRGSDVAIPSPSPLSPTVSFDCQPFSPSPLSRVSGRIRESVGGLEKTLENHRNKQSTPSRRPKLPSSAPPVLPERPRERDHFDMVNDNASTSGTLRRTKLFTPKYKPLPPTPSAN